MTPWRPSSWSLAVKLPLIVCLVVAGVAGVTGFTVIQKERIELRQALAEKAVLMSRWIAAASAEPMMRNDVWPIWRNLRQVTSKEVDEGRDVLTAMVLDTEGVVMAHLQPGPNPIGLPLHTDGDETRLLERALRSGAPLVLEDPAGGFVEGVAPVVGGGKRLGVARVRLSTRVLAQAVGEATGLVLLATFGLALIGSLAGIYASLRAVRPLGRLADAMSSLARGEPVAVPVRGADEIAHLSVTFNAMAAEVAEKQRLERELAQAEKTAALGRIAAGVAHEVNNPLAGILNCISTLKDHPQEPGLLERYLPVFERGLLRIRAIVQDLLVEQRAEHASEPCGPECLDEVRDLVAAEIEGKSIVLDWRNDLAPDTTFNRQRLQQALLNLLRNAVQAMPAGGRLSVSARREDGVLAIVVEDTGVGIAPEDVGRVFDPFFTSRKTGTGLGLWITWRLVQSLGGTIEVASRLGEGSRFTLSIPLGGPDGSIAD